MINLTSHLNYMDQNTSKIVFSTFFKGNFEPTYMCIHENASLFKVAKFQLQVHNV